MNSFFGELQRRNVVRVALLYGVVAWVLIQIVDIVMPRLGIPEWGVTLVIVLLAIGLPIALIFAWAFELTPEGIKRTGEVDPDASITPDTGQKLNHLIIGVLAVAVAYLLVDKFFLASVPDGERSRIEIAEAPLLTSIAVLPFADMSPAKDQEYFTDGISEELLNLLAKIPDFKVAGRTSSFAFKNKNDDLRIIGEKLGVATILEGSVRKQKDQIRVTAQLVKVDDGYHLWSDTYDRQLDDVFAIQDEIATEVVGALKQTLLGEEDKAVLASAPRTQNTEAYTAYLRGKHVMRVRNEETLYLALREFRHATNIDPGFAPAWAGVANAYSLLANYEYRQADEVLPLARDAVEMALSLDPQLSDAWAAKGLLLMQENDRDEAAIPVLQKAVEHNPSDAQTLMWLGTELRSARRLEEASAILARAYEIDPLFPSLLANLALGYASVGDVDGTSRYLAELESVAPDSRTTIRSRALAYWNLGRVSDAFRVVREGYDAGVFDSLTLGLLADWSLDLGDAQQAARYAVSMRQINPLSAWATTTDAAILYLDGREQEATDLLDDALLHQPEDALLCLAQCRLPRGTLSGCRGGSGRPGAVCGRVPGGCRPEQQHICVMVEQLPSGASGCRHRRRGGDETPPAAGRRSGRAVHVQHAMGHDVHPLPGRPGGHRLARTPRREEGRNTPVTGGRGPDRGRGYGRSDPVTAPVAVLFRRGPVWVFETRGVRSGHCRPGETYPRARSDAWVRVPASPGSHRLRDSLTR
jgi:TolB-like protein/Flp pilus assembly protein TadD